MKQGCVRQGQTLGSPRPDDDRVSHRVDVGFTHNQGGKGCVPATLRRQYRAKESLCRLDPSISEGQEIGYLGGHLVISQFRKAFEREWVALVDSCPQFGSLLCLGRIYPVL